MKALIHTTVFALLLTSSATAKRSAPTEVPAITTAEAVYSVPHFGFQNGTDQNGGVILAHHPRTKKLLWRIQIYKTIYEKELEQDVQNVFIKTFTLDKVHNLLIMSDEESRVFALNLTTKKVTQIK
jgi:hypothetical protein